MYDPGGADIPREPSKAEWPMVHFGVKGGMVYVQDPGAMGPGGAEHSEAGGGASCFSHPGGDGSQRVQGVAAPQRGG